MLVIAVPDTLRARRMIETARILNPPVEIIVRTHNEEEAALLRRESGGAVFLGEHELALQHDTPYTGKSCGQIRNQQYARPSVYEGVQWARKSGRLATAVMHG